MKCSHKPFWNYERNKKNRSVFNNCPFALMWDGIPSFMWENAKAQKSTCQRNFYHYLGHLKFVCILFFSTLNNFRSQITGACDQSSFRLVQETQELYPVLWYSTSIFQFNNRLTCACTPWDERRKERVKWRGYYCI